MGSLVEYHGPALGNQGFRWAFLLCFEVERKPSKVNRLVGSPERASAVIAAVGPGTGRTSIPFSAQSFTRSSPGSEMAAFRRR
jgi:hypothetical protein